MLFKISKRDLPCKFPADAMAVKVSHKKYQSVEYKHSQNVILEACHLTVRRFGIWIVRGEEDMMK